MTERTCSVAGCDDRHLARGLCSKHYRRWYVHGDPLGGQAKPRGTLAERFWAKVERSDGCWLWTGGKNRLGYGRIGGEAGGRNRSAHRVAYEFVVGPIPTGLEIDHLCRNPSCVNPEHLEPVTHRENVLRGEAPSARDARKTHCKRGHPFDNTNTHITPDGSRYCRACERVRKRERNDMKKKNTTKILKGGH